MRMNLKTWLAPVLLALLALAPLSAGAASLYVAKWQQFHTDAGVQLNGGKLYFYVTTTTTPKNTYPTEADAIAGTNANANPVVLDSDGRAPQEIWISGRYRLITKTSADVTISDDDPIEDVVTGSDAQDGAQVYCGTNSGSANALAFTCSPAVTAYSAGLTLRGRITADNSGAVTVNVNGVGVKSMVKRDGGALVAGDLQGPDIIQFTYDATADVFRLGGPSASVQQSARADVASVAGTTDLSGSTNYVRITGTNTITALTLADGHWREVVAGGAFSITTSASLIIEGLPSGTTYAFASGDTFVARGEASSVVRVTLHQPPRLDAVTATTEVVSSAAETTVYTKSTPGGTLGTDRALRLTLIGDYFNNSGAAREITIKVKYGATTVCNVILNAILGSATRKTVLITANLFAKGATNSQVAACTNMLDSGTATQTGVGLTQFNHMAGASGHNAIAIDSTADQTLLVTIQHSTSDANLSFKTLSARLEVIR